MVCAVGSSSLYLVARRLPERRIHSSIGLAGGRGSTRETSARSRRADGCPPKERERASSRSGDRLFELDLGGEAVVIAPDRQNRQLPAAMPVNHGAVLRLETAVNLDPVPLPGI